MTIKEQKSVGYITLKEASELFGYSPDYIGQLIRKGKIEGKQVYANVAWVTTKETIEEYLAREKKGMGSEDITHREALLKLLTSERSAIYADWALRALIPVLVVILVAVFYFVSISIDHKLARDAERRLDKTTQVAAIGSVLSADGAILTYEK
jgi:hypothetical protein